MWRGLRAGVEFQWTRVQMAGCARQQMGLCAACSRDGLEGAGGAVCPGFAGLGLSFARRLRSWPWQRHRRFSKVRRVLVPRSGPCR